MIRLRVLRRPPRAMAAPLLGLVLMLCMGFVFSLPGHDAAALRARTRQVVAAFSRAPYRIGSWVGEDVEVPRGAIEILRPAAILSRRYSNVESGLVADLLIIYCNDSRDMEGHFPPVCYPANGWVASGTNTVSVEVADKTIPMRVYEFLRIKGWRTESQLRVFNVFLTPKGTMTGSFSEIRRVPFRHPYTTGGVGQIQVITPGDWELHRSAAVCSELLTGLSQLLTDLAGGGQEQ